MNLLHVVHYPVFGGPHNQALRLAGPLATRGYQTIALLPDEPGNAVERLRVGGVETITMPLHRLRAKPDLLLQSRFLAGFPREVRAIRRLIRERNIDIVLVCGLVNPHAAIAARLEGVPVVWQIVDTRPPMVLRRALMPVVRRLSDVVMSTGMAVARVHPGATSLGGRLVTFFPPVATAEYRPDPARRAAARAELGIPPGSLAIGTVGNLNPQKGHEFLIRATGIVRKACPGIGLRILGARTPTQPEYEQRLRSDAAELGLERAGVSIFVEPGARVAELLPAFDVFVLSALPLSEGIPTVILEAMACGLPVVSTDVGAVREAVEDCATGYVVPAEDSSAIANRVLRLLGDPELRARMGALARARAVERYDSQACADVHQRAFERAVAHAATRRRQPRRRATSG